MTASDDRPVSLPALGTDPASGLVREARGSGHGHDCATHAHPAEAGGFVREARPSDLDAIGAVHATTMLASLEQAHSWAHEGEALPAGVRAMIAPPVLTAGWEQAVLAPPSPRHHVLVATVGEEVVGLIGVGPTQGVSPEAGTQTGTGQSPEHKQGEQDVETGAEVTALGVVPAHQRQGHGSRLLAAASDYARQDGASVLLSWSVRGDESVEGLLSSVGMERTPSYRELPVGRGITESCWAAAL